MWDKVEGCDREAFEAWGSQTEAVAVIAMNLADLGSTEAESRVNMMPLMALLVTCFVCPFQYMPDLLKKRSSLNTR